MNYLDYPRHDDTSARTRLKHEIADAQVAVKREMYGARIWKSREGGDFRKRAITNQARRAREANHRLIHLKREWRELEATP